MSAVYLPYSLRFRSKALVTGSGSDPNSVVSLSHVPGSTLRGAFASRLISGPVDAVASAELRKWVLDGEVTCLNAYPSPAHGTTRSCPVPSSWREKKYDTGSHVDLFRYAGAQATDPVVRPAAEFVTLLADDPEWVPVRMGAQVHHQRDPDRGRAWKKKGTPDGVGTLFTYECIEPGQTFCGVIRFAGAAVAEELTAAVPTGTLLLIGRSRRAGYGGEAELEWGSAADVEWPSANRLSSAGQHSRLRLLMTSPCIVRSSATGQIDPKAIEAEIEAAFNTRKAPKPVVVSGSAAATRITGYNRTWRMRVPEVLAVAAGSVFELTFESPISADILRDLEDAALGERHVEGFGRILFLPPPTMIVSIRSASEKPPSLAPSAHPPDVLRLLRQMEREILTARLDRLTDLKASEIAGRVKVDAIPKPSVLARMALPLQRDSQNGAATLAKYLDGDAGASRSQEETLRSLERCRIPGRPGHLRNLLQTVVAASATDAALVELLPYRSAADGVWLTAAGSGEHALKESLPAARRMFAIRVLSKLQKIRSDRAAEGANHGD